MYLINYFIFQYYLKFYTLNIGALFLTYQVIPVIIGIEKQAWERKHENKRPSCEAHLTFRIKNYTEHIIFLRTLIKFF